MVRLTKIETEDYSGIERIKSPLIRLFWYFITFGKWGERYHYKNVPMRRYITVPDKRLEINISANTLRFTESLQSMKIYSCRCSIKGATGVLASEQTNKKD